MSMELFHQCLKRRLYSTELLLCLCHKSAEHTCVADSPSSLFWSIYLGIYDSVSTAVLMTNQHGNWVKQFLLGILLPNMF